ncbi:xanthine dehydrogenase molybdopterin binding subunit [Kordiimonas sp. SCSIO 12603]|uniref:xanthine dehydrogenase molybdopterin binding subunit n=1 Tax=Kordiimonas sp. SCSIO 12603 TaxID=2829596 RepID=UPI002101FC36|nr:xanthine dehydrogenase molybdopterin binding subunit [Kordiimonas sp. SCSIO 12603]UTW59338.1 xanthine dehydrogenase molybdopterin binding subunit [Kordiimonas sp. SCSIO 12603]
MSNPSLSEIKGAVHKDLRHDSAHKHVAGTAVYIDDVAEPKNMLHMYVAMSEKAHAEITEMDLSAVRAAQGVAVVLTADDIPGHNDVSPFAGDDPLFSTGLVEYIGQPIFAVAANSLEEAIAAAKLAKVSYDEKPHYLNIDEAEAADLKIEDSQLMAQGEAEKALAASKNRLQGSFYIGGQDHFYLEGQIAFATPQEDGDVHVLSSTQHPSEVQHLVAHVLGRPTNAVTIEVRRMGGGFGGKETHPAMFAAMSSLAAVKTQRPVKLRLDRDDDMVMTGKRHDFKYSYDVGYDDDGRITGIEIEMASRCGRSTDLSPAINDRAMFHADNCYFLSDVAIRSHRYKTHTVSNTAFRGFGGPQGMIGIERVIEDVAREIGKDPLDVRMLNLYGEGERDTTPYGMKVEDNVAAEVMETLAETSEYRKRRDKIRAFNASSKYLKKGISITPVKFGISFTTTHLNQAGALVHIYADGSVHLNHGGTEMGQGLFTKVAQVVAEEFQIDVDHVKITATTTAKVPNTSATAASSGSDLNGMAALDAARKIKARLIDFAAEKYGCPKDRITFRNNKVYIENKEMAFNELTQEAYLGRVSMSSTGFYKTPKIKYDRASHKGRPFYYFCYGAAVSEVMIDTLTGENKVLRTDILHETGRSLNPVIDIGQIEGGFIQGMGWLTTEELVFDDAGRLRTHAPSTYKVPACSDRPDELNIELWNKGRNVEATIHRSKAVGEPPFMLANAVFMALVDAVASVGDYRVPVKMDAPATPEEVLMAVADVKKRA